MLTMSQRVSNVQHCCRNRIWIIDWYIKKFMRTEHFFWITENYLSIMDSIHDKFKNTSAENGSLWWQKMTMFETEHKCKRLYLTIAGFNAFINRFPPIIRILFDVYDMNWWLIRHLLLRLHQRNFMTSQYLVNQSPSPLCVWFELFIYRYVEYAMHLL